MLVVLAATARSRCRWRAQPRRTAAPARLTAQSSGVGKAIDAARRAKCPRRKPRDARRLDARHLRPLRYTAPTSAEALASDIGTFLNARVRSGNWGAMIVSLTRGDTLYSANPGDLLLPASTMKLFTAALAFDTFGPEHQFTTTVLRDGTVGPDGTLNGNLVLRGGGDPGLSSRYYRAPAEGPMASLARMVAASGIKRVSGDLVADASAFESKRVPDGWLARYLESGYAARVSALSMNENLATVVITPQPNGRRGGVSLDPPSSTVPVINNAAHGRRKQGREARRFGVSPTAASMSAGWIGSKAGAAIVSRRDRRSCAVGRGRATVRARGRRASLSPARSEWAPRRANAVSVASLSSPPLTRLAVCDESREHQPLCGAAVPRRRVRREPRPHRLGRVRQYACLRKFMTEKVGATATDITAADGSGLSTLDRVTARSLVQLLVVRAPRRRGRRISTRRCPSPANRSCCAIACATRPRRGTCTRRPARRTT